MDYADVKSLALSYADRDDVEVSDRIDNFLVIVESRVNRFLQTRKMSSRVIMITDDDQEYYGLPSDFNGLRDIEMRDTLDSTCRTTLKYLAPEAMNAVETSDGVYYSIIGNQLLLRPAQENKILEVTYYQMLPAISDTNVSNWLSEDFPDAYVFGLLVEINAFVKDAEASLKWEQRFKDSLDQINSMDSRNRWSGTSLEVRVG